MSKKFFWMCFSLVLLVLNIYCLRINLNADSLFPYRYAESLFEYDVSRLFVQPGLRMFPEWFYGVLAYSFTADLILWSRIVIFCNTLVLGFSLVYFFSSLGISKHQNLLYTAILMLAIPILNLLHLNILIYLVFSPGIHGFLLAYVVICLALLFKWILSCHVDKLTATSYVLLSSVVISSNINFIVMFILPACFICTVVFLKAKNSRKILIKILLLLLLSVMCGYLLTNLIYTFFVDMVFLKNKFVFFEHGAWEWINENELFSEIGSLNRSGYFLYLLVFSSILSFWILFKQWNLKIKPIFLLNIYVVSILPIFMFVAYAVDKSLLRLMPHIVFFSQGVLFVNIAYIFRDKINANATTLILLLLATIAINKYYNPQSPYVQHDKIIVFLDELRKNHDIKGDGLSDYWVSNALLNQPSVLLPIHASGVPMMYAVDANKFWNNLGNERHIDHIINTKMRNAKTWILNESELTTRYGSWTKMKTIEIKNRLYKIYVYPDGIDKELFYESVNAEIQKRRLISK